jgi:hypothetical protein
MPEDNKQPPEIDVVEQPPIQKEEKHSKKNEEKVNPNVETQIVELSNISFEEEDNILKLNTKDLVKIIKKDQDQEQKYKVYFLFLIEIFKVAMASFLSISVVQKCDDGICSFSENLERKSVYGNLVIAVNTANILAFGILYFIEFNREMFMIKYLDVDKHYGDYHLPSLLDGYEDIKIRLIKYNKNYYLSTKVLLGLTSLNWVLSGILVLSSYYSMKTATSFITNILLVITKLSDSYSVSKESTKNNYGLSAYIKEYTSFNVIDKDHAHKE